MEIKNQVIGILGTAKNTGKTTTAGFLLEWANKVNISVGITSIGYDGEDIDNITGLPKPRIYVKEGNLVGTAEQCLPVSGAKIKVIQKTPVKTSLGQIMIGRVVQDGLIVLAGPNKGKDLLYILQRLKQQKSQMILVDGALNRMIPLVYCDALILATGASRNTDINLLVNETKSICSLYQLPLRIDRKISNLEIRENDEMITIFKKNGTKTCLNERSMIKKKTADYIIQNIDEDTEEIFIPGIIHDMVLKEMVKQYHKLLMGKAILISNPAFLLVASKDISHLKDLIDEIHSYGIKVQTLQHFPILAVIINPFYPRYNRYGKESYEGAWIDYKELYQEMRYHISLPVINIKEKGSQELLRVIAAFLSDNKLKTDTMELQEQQ